MRDFTAELGVDVCGVELAVSEAVADAVVHDGGDVELTARSVDAHARGRGPRTGATGTRRRSASGSPSSGGSPTHVGIDDGLGGHALTLRFRRLGRG